MSSKPRARIALGVTVPLGGTYGNVRAEAMFEDYLRPIDKGSTRALRKRVSKTARLDLRRELVRFFKKYGLTPTGDPKGDISWL